MDVRLGEGQGLCGMCADMARGSGVRTSGAMKDRLPAFSKASLFRKPNTLWLRPMPQSMACRHT
jgi:hypothetical protein